MFNLHYRCSPKGRVLDVEKWNDLLYCSLLYWTRWRWVTIFIKVEPITGFQIFQLFFQRCFVKSTQKHLNFADAKSNKPKCYKTKRESENVTWLKFLDEQKSMKSCGAVYTNKKNVKRMNLFQRLNEVKKFKIFLFAQRANTRKQASSSDAFWRQQSRTAQARGDRMTCQWADNQQLYNCPTMTSWAHRGSLSKRRQLVLSSLTTRPPLFSPSLGPRSLTLRVSFPCICSPPVCIIRSVTSLSLATTTWTPEHPFFSTNCCPNTSSDITCVLGGGSRLSHTVFPPKGLLLSGQGGCSRRPYQG